VDAGGLALAASPRFTAERGGRRAAAIAAAAAINATSASALGGPLPSAMAALVAKEAIENTKAAVAEAAEFGIDADYDLASDSDDEVLRGGAGLFGGSDAVRSEWDLQQRVSLLRARERRATQRMYMASHYPDRLPDRDARTRAALRYNGNGRLTTDGAPALCANLPLRASCAAVRRRRGRHRSRSRKRLGFRVSRRC
jgi:hypothetical protein